MKKVFTYILVLILITSRCYSQNKDILWSVTYGGSLVESAHAVGQTLDGGYIVCGLTESDDGDVIGHHGYFDVWVVKLDNQGSLQWAKSYGGSDSDSPTDIAETSDHGYLIIGSTESTDGDVSGNHGLYDAWVVKIDSVGDIQWQKCYGGSEDDVFYEVMLADNKGYYVIGYSASSDGDLTVNKGSVDMWLVHIDSVGNIIWSTSFGGNGVDQGISLSKSPNNEIACVLTTDSKNGDLSNADCHDFNDILVLVLDSLGNPLKTRCLGGSNNELATSISLMPDSTHLITGYSRSSDGDLTSNKGSFDYWIVKLNLDGEIVWQRSQGGSESDLCHDAAMVWDQGIAVIGVSESSDGDVSYNHGIFDDVWLVKLSENGEVEWEYSYGGSVEDVAYSILINNSGDYIFAGGSASNDGDVPDNSGSGDFWIAALASSTSLESSSNFEQVTVFPNPSAGTLWIQWPYSFHYSVAIFDMAGRKLLHREISTGQPLDLSSFGNGIYFLTVWNENHYHTKKFLVLLDLK